MCGELIVLLFQQNVFYTFAGEDGQVKLKRHWNKFAKEWRCANVYSKKTKEFVSLLTAEVLEAAVAPTLKKRPVS